MNSTWLLFPPPAQPPPLALSARLYHSRVCCSVILSVQYFLYHRRLGPVPHSVNTSDFLSPVVIHFRSVTSFLSVSRFQQSLLLRFFMSRYIVSFSAFHYSLFHFLLFVQHFTCSSLSLIRVILYLSLAFFLDRLILLLSPIFLAYSFLYLLCHYSSCIYVSLTTVLPLTNDHSLKAKALEI